MGWFVSFILDVLKTSPDSFHNCFSLKPNLLFASAYPFSFIYTKAFNVIIFFSNTGTDLLLWALVK